MPYKSNNPSIASVDSNGTVTGVAVGSTTIEQTSESGVLLKRGNVNVVSSTAPAYVPTTGITLSKKTVTLYYTNRAGASTYGDNYAFITATVTPNSATNKTIKYWVEKDGERIDACIISLNPQRKVGYTEKLYLRDAFRKNTPTGDYTLVVQAADGQKATCALKIIKDGCFVVPVDTTVYITSEAQTVRAKVSYYVYDNYDCGLDTPIVVPGTKVNTGDSNRYLVRDAIIEIPVKKNYGGEFRQQYVIRGRYESTNGTYDYKTETWSGVGTVTIIQEGSTECVGFNHGADALFSASGSQKMKDGHYCILYFTIGENMYDAVMENVTMDDWIHFSYTPIKDFEHTKSLGSYYEWYDENGELHGVQGGYGGNFNGYYEGWYVGITTDPNPSTEQRVGWVKFPNNKWFKVVQEGVEA